MFNEKEYMKEYLKNYYKKHKNKLDKRVKIWKKEHPLEMKLHRKKYKEKHKTELNKKFKIKEKTDPQFKIINRLRHRVNMVCKAKNVKKNYRFKKYIGCSPAKLIAYLESKFSSGMTKENYGKWHIDHIKPCVSFDRSDPTWQLKCFHYTNLQPLWAEENLKKGSK